ncbi:RidA family protein [Streptomyces sp. 35G-GA-8]|uniref:RidA family protein n=1 Tax=Streptomyces sp. 35G-GA-8 TaxID=2939434 RepID=UPI00201EAC9A|nr:RidA family protein [Streptomyces sp. 35G-GA-8]MCL7379880.1 RidA family protein [Streptomyces sp. 35G-GA-8]
MIEHVDPPALAPPVGGLYHHLAIARTGSVVAIAGQVALDAEGRLVGEGDHVSQAEQAFRNVATALAAVGCGPHDLLKNTIHVVGHRPDLVEPVFAAGRRAFGGHWPRSASTFIGVQALGRPEWLIEVDGLAVVPAHSPLTQHDRRAPTCTEEHRSTT